MVLGKGLPCRGSHGKRISLCETVSLVPSPSIMLRSGRPERFLFPACMGRSSVHWTLRLQDDSSDEEIAIDMPAVESVSDVPSCLCCRAPLHSLRVCVCVCVCVSVCMYMFVGLSLSLSASLSLSLSISLSLFPPDSNGHGFVRKSQQISGRTSAATSRYPNNAPTFQRVPLLKLYSMYYAATNGRTSATRILTKPPTPRTEVC